MEPIGLAMGILSLYNAFTEVLRRIDDYKDFGTDSQMTVERYNASKLRLENWAKVLGIRDGELVKSHDSRLDDPKTASVIVNILRCLNKVFDKVEHANASIKSPVRINSAGTFDWSIPLDEATNATEQNQHISTRSRIAWVMGGKSKLNKNVGNFEGLVNVLYDVVPPRESETLSGINCMTIAECFFFETKLIAISITSS